MLINVTTFSHLHMSHSIMMACGICYRFNLQTFKTHADINGGEQMHAALSEHTTVFCKGKEHTIHNQTIYFQICNHTRHHILQTFFIFYFQRLFDCPTAILCKRNGLSKTAQLFNSYHHRTFQIAELAHWGWEPTHCAKTSLVMTWT